MGMVMMRMKKNEDESSDDENEDEFRCPLQNMAWTRQGGGHNAD